jgi:amidase
MLLSSLLAVSCGFSAVKAATLPYAPLPDLFDLTIDDIVQGFAAKQFTSVDLVKAYIARIAEVQETLRPVIEVNPEAIEIAQALDNERLTMNKTRGPLHGVPVLLKDNIGTADLLNTTAGSYALYGSIVPRDSTVAANLRAAGAVILGKAGMTEWAFWRSANFTNGWSGRGGQVKGAYYYDQDPSGSSSGSAVAASIGLSAFTVGSDTGGSIISPASTNGVVGLRTSTGLVSRSVVVPITPVMDTVGPIGRTVKDIAYALSGMAGKDPTDNATAAIPFDTVPDYASFCEKDGLQGARLGIPRNIFTAPANRTERDIQQISAFEAVLPLLQRLGANITDSANYPNITAYQTQANFNLACNVGFKYAGMDYFKSLKFNPSGITTLQQLINYTMNFKAELYPLHNVDWWQAGVDTNLTLDSPEYLDQIALNAWLGSNGTIQGALDNYDLDALVLPSAYSVRPTVYAGYPVITVPLGFFNATTKVIKSTYGPTNSTGPGIPFGISFIGRRFDEATIIKYAYAFEQATQFRYAHLPMPQYMPTTQLNTVQANAPASCPAALGLPY